MQTQLIARTDGTSVNGQYLADATRLAILRGIGAGPAAAAFAAGREQDPATVKVWAWSLVSQWTRS